MPLPAHTYRLAVESTAKTIHLPRSLRSLCMQHCEINGAEVSRIGLSASAFGGAGMVRVSDADAIHTCLAALEQGINLIDTSHIWHSRADKGRAERIVGEAIVQHGCREDFYIAAGCRLEWASGKSLTSGISQRMERELVHSLQRLNIAHIDLYQVHAPTLSDAELGGAGFAAAASQAPIEEIAAAMARFLREGRIRAIGVSDFSIAQMDRFRAAAPHPCCTTSLQLV